MFFNANYFLQQHAKVFENSSVFNKLYPKFELCIENHEVFGSLTQNYLQLDKDKSTVFTFSVILVNKYAVITTQKSSYVESFSFGQQRLVFAHLCPDISIKSR